MDAALIASAALLGLAGTPHCAAMCGAPCAAVVGPGRPVAQLAFHGARVTGYALGGAVAAASVGALQQLSSLSPALRPLWVLLHVAALALGLWLLVTARQPEWLGRIGRAPALVLAGGAAQPLHGPRAGLLRAALGGGLWVAWPCGLLQSALLVASMANSAAAGAAAMAAFALASSAGLLAAPWAWRRLLAGRTGPARERWLVRAAGLLLVAASGFALGHGIWHQVLAYCATL